MISDLDQIKLMHTFPAELMIDDHLGGFDKNLNNPILDKIHTYAASTTPVHVHWHNIASDQLRTHYPNLIFHYDIEWQRKLLLDQFFDYTQHPDIDYHNFLCSFNGTPHVSRKLLTACIKKFNWFDKNYVSKNFGFTANELDGHIFEYVGDQSSFYNKFFIDEHSDEFFTSISSFGHERFDHAHNIYNLEKKLTQSFVNVVSETMATSHVPFVTEKFLYSVVTRGLWIAYAQPGWHSHVEKYYGFRKYNQLFDYQFDDIANPVHRIIELMSMLAKFSLLAASDWHDLRLLEQDNIEFNYNHYYSGDFIKHLTHATT